MISLKVGVLGSGQVGKVLASGFIKHGHSVMVGTRNPSKLSDWVATTDGKGRVGSFSDAAKFGEIVVLAVKGTSALEALALAGSDHLKGKTIIDTTNPIAEEPPVNGVLKFFTDLNGSLMERLQAHVPAANFVKAFSCIGNAFMVNPQFTEGKPTMFICGNSDPAKKAVTDILVQFGWDIADMGKAEAARAIEPLCILWCIPGFISNSWSHAFKLVRK